MPSDPAMVRYRQKPGRGTRMFWPRFARTEMDRSRAPEPPLVNKMSFTQTSTTDTYNTVHYTAFHTNDGRNSSKSSNIFCSALKSKSQALLESQNLNQSNNSFYPRNPLTPTVAVGTAIKHTVPDRVKPSFVIFDIRALWRTGTGLTRYDTACL